VKLRLQHPCTPLWRGQVKNLLWFKHIPLRKRRNVRTFISTFDLFFTLYKNTCTALWGTARSGCCKSKSKGAGTVGPVLYETARGESETSLHEFLTSALGGGEWSYLLSGGFTPMNSGDEIAKNEMDVECSTYWRKERCIQGFGGETWGKETTCKTQA
jgi:hypothetical protein